MLWFSRFDRVQWPVQKLARLGGCDLACERQTFLLAHRRWGMFREEERTQRQKIHTDDVNQCLHSHGVPNAKLFLLAKRSSAAMSEKKRLPFAGYWGATLPPQKSDPARRINLLAEPTFFCKQLATLAYGSDHFFFTPELIDPQDGLGLYNLVSRAFPFSLALSFGRDWHLWRARQEPITWSMQLPYLAYAKAFSHISLFLAPFGSTFRREIGSTVPYECASILIGRQ